jgi:hypothetical protein
MKQVWPVKSNLPSCVAASVISDSQIKKGRYRSSQLMIREACLCNWKQHAIMLSWYTTVVHVGRLSSLLSASITYTVLKPTMVKPAAIGALKRQCTRNIDVQSSYELTHVLPKSASRSVPFSVLTYDLYNPSCQGILHTLCVNVCVGWCPGSLRGRL